MAEVAYAYRVRTREGALREGTMEAATEAAVVQRLRAQGMVPIEISRQQGVQLRGEIKLIPKRVGLKDKAVFARQFATMISSGLSLLRGLSILAEQSENPKLAETIATTRDDVERGSSLSDAMAKHPKVFDKLFVSLVRAGETSGQLDTVLKRVAESFEKDYKLRQKIKAAMTYPVVVFFIAISLVIVMLIFIVPTFANMFTGLGGTLPLPTRILLAMSQRAVILVPLAIVLSVGGFVSYRSLRKSNADFRLTTDKLKLRFPVFGDLFSKIALSRFARTLALLLRSGVPILQALDITSEASGNEVITRATQDVKTSVSQGGSLSSPLSTHAVFPPMIVQMIAVGEDTGQVDSLLDKVAEFYEQEVESTTESLTALLEPLMIAFLGGIVGSMVVALYMPMFKIFDLIR
jgi:type IV pilus assembly protein PilC